MLRSKPKPDVHVYRDGRVRLSGAAYQQMRQLLCDLAGSHCEMHGCGKYTGLASGQVHHIIHRGMGSAKRDDRVFVAGVRQLMWLCPACHTGRHQPAKVVPAKPSPDELKQLLGL